MLKSVLLFFFIYISQICFAQTSSVTTVVKGLKNGDSALVRIQQSKDQYFSKKIYGIAANADVSYAFASLTNGKWSISVDVNGYSSPSSKVVDLNNSTLQVVITLTASATSNFSYQWEDDSSFVGHAQQAYINDTVSINVLGKAEKVPSEFNSINLLNDYGFLLSDEGTAWTSEDAYRLSQTILSIGFGKKGQSEPVVVKAKWVITDLFIDKDLQFTTQNGIDIITISRSAFLYSSPLVVTLDGIKGKFFSKRLNTAIVYYYSNKGTDTYKIANLAKTKYGFEFLEPSDQLQNLMGETKTNFQAFTPSEKLSILSMFEEFPSAMQYESHLKYLVRRINGQRHPIEPTALAIAHTGTENIEFMESAFTGSSFDVQRVILHEKAHFLWSYTFDNITKSNWATTGAWSLDPTAASGWSTTNTTEFVSAYAHLKDPNEDMAESFAYYVINPDALRSRSLLKFEFIRDRIMKGTRYISVIRPDLTFQVYNLYPDYNYPGKIVRTKVDVTGGPLEDKVVTIQVELHTEAKLYDGASSGLIRINSSKGTIADIGLAPINASGSILRGQITLSKFAKNGYWTAASLTIRDQVGNERIENPANIGLKVYINNPLEDLIAPRYIEKSMSLSLVKDKFLNDGWGGIAKDVCGACADTLPAKQAIRMSFKMEEKNVMQDGMAMIQMIMPTKPGLQSKSIPFQKYSFSNDFTDSTKVFLAYRVIEDYQPTGYYVTADGNMYDKAGNSRSLTFDLDKNNLNYDLNEGKGQRSLRDSVYIKTDYPDELPPILDLNNIKVKATPTNPTNPNGETNVELWTRIKDTSAYAQHAAGLMFGEFCLRDPQGLQHWYSMQINSIVKADSSRLGIYLDYYVKVLLPVGSAPGTWGVQEIRIGDNADNRKNYDFTQLVRFDLDTSTVLRIDPYVEILGKKVNAKNVDSVGVKLGCKNCKNQNYRVTIYSSMGGNSVVLQGAMTADTVSLYNLKLAGVNDGIIYATVFILDSTAAMIGTGRASYTKDVLLPKPANVLANLASLGKSNLDSLVIDMKVSELKGEYNIVVVQSTIAKPPAIYFEDNFVKTFGVNANNPSVGDTVIIAGQLADSLFKIKNLPLSQFQDGLITLMITFIDSVGNESTPVTSYFYKDTKDPVATITKLSSSNFKAVYSIQSNEYLSNTLTSENISLQKGTVDSLVKISNSLYNLYITRVCNDTLSITLKANALIDTVGNKSLPAYSQLIDLILPVTPIVTASRPLAFCTGDSTVLTVPSASNYQWFKDGVAINGATSASIKIYSSGTYTDSVINILGCKNGSVLKTVVVSTFPVVAAITGTATVCVGSTTILTNATAGGVWSSGSVAVATISNTGVVTGISAGTCVINYSLTNAAGCVTVVTSNITVNPVPVVAITGGTKIVCVGSTTSLTNATAGGVWSSGSASVATISNIGLVTGISGGTSIISYSLTNATGCVTSDKTTITVNALPVVAAISGNTNACVGSTTSLTNATSGGVWTSGTAAVATIGTTGVVTALSAGTSIISYSLTNANACVTVVTATTNVFTVPVVASLAGTMSVCVGSSTTLTNTTTGGVWSSGSTAVVSISTSGVINALSAGTSTISYTVTNGGTCVTAVTATVTANSVPTVTAISGTAIVCAGSTTNLSNSTTNGVWTSGTPAIATIGTTGTVTGLTAGASTISYTVSNASGCVTAVTAPVTVKALPAKPTVNWNGTDLSTTSTATSLQWLLNNVSVSGATLASYKPIAIGLYKIQATNTDGCKIASDSFNLVVTAINNPATANISNPATLIPNPASTMLLVKFNEAPLYTMNMQLLTNGGLLIKSVKTKNRITAIPISELPAGNYFIKITGNKYDQTLGVIISH